MSHRDVEELEQAFSDLLGVQYVVAVNSGTAGLMSALLSLELPTGSEVVCAAYTWPQVRAVADALGLRISCADCDDSGRLTAEAAASAMSPDTRAIVVCHLFGNPVDVAGIARLAHTRSVAVIEDCSQALLAKLYGHPVGTWGDIGFTSLGRGKPLSAIEGGLVWTNSVRLYQGVFAVSQHPDRATDTEAQRACLTRSLSLRMHPAGAEMALRALPDLRDEVALTSGRYEQGRALIADVPGIDLVDVLPAATPAWTCLPVTVSEDVSGRFEPYCAKLRPAYLLAADRRCPEAVSFEHRVRFLELNRSPGDADVWSLKHWAAEIRQAAAGRDGPARGA